MKIHDMKHGIFRYFGILLLGKENLMKTFAITIIVSLFAGISTMNSQPIISWQKTVGGTNHEYVWKTIPTSDGGLAFVGFSESNDGDVSGNHGGVDLWVGKLNSSGNFQWSNLFGGTGDEEGYDILQTADGGYMVVGWTASLDGDVTGHHGTYGDDVWILKLTSTGTLTWENCYGGTSDDNATAIAQTQSGNFYVSGTTYSNDGDVSGNHGTNSDFWVIKINATGTLLGQKCVGGTDFDDGINMTITSDDGCILCGSTGSSDGDAIGYHGGDDMLIAKLNSLLGIDWSKCYGGTETEECNSIVQLSDGTYAALGYTSTQNNGDVAGHHGSQGSDDFWLLKITTIGTITWAKCYGGSGDDQADGLTKTSDGGFVMCGLTNSMDGDVSGFHFAAFDPDAWVLKVDAAGIFQWQHCCGGSGQDESFNVFELSSGIYVVSAFTYSNDYDVSGNHGNADGWIFKISMNTAVENISNEEHISIYPNPASDQLTIEAMNNSTIEIMNPEGQIVRSFSFTESINTIDLNEFSAGVYTIRIRMNKGVFSKKMVKL